MTIFEMAMSLDVYILTGSNLGKREYYLEEARNRLEVRIGTSVHRSSVYESEPWGYKSQNKFLNQVLRINSELLPQEVLSQCLIVEAELGRTRPRAEVLDRTIDIDILFYGDWVVHEPGLTIPHPRIIERRFVLLPMVEISPGFIHPGDGRSMQQMLQDCTDSVGVGLFKPLVQ